MIMAEVFGKICMQVIMRSPMGRQLDQMGASGGHPIDWPIRVATATSTSSTQSSPCHHYQGPLDRNASGR